MSALRRLLTLTPALALVAATVACGPGGARSGPSSTSDSHASATPTGSAGPDDCATAASGELWRTGLTGPLSAAAQDTALAYVLVAAGSTLRSLDACDGEPVGSLTLDGPAVRAPVLGVVEGQGVGAFVATTSGSVHRVTVDPESGALDEAWSHSLARDTCPNGDRISAAPAVAEGVVYVGTEYGCGAGQNRVTALKATTGAELWSFTEAIGAVRAAPVPDPANNRLYVGTYLAAGTGQTLYALNLATGSRLWSANAGSLVVPPLPIGDRVYTADQQGNVRAWPTGGSQHSPLWTMSVGAGVEVGLVDFGSIDVVDSVLLVAASGGITPVTYDGLARPKITLPTGQVSSAPAPYPAEGVFYVGGTDGRMWQLDVLGTVEIRRDVAPGAAVRSGTLVFGDPSIVVGTSSGELIKLAVPWPNE